MAGGLKVAIAQVTGLVTALAAKADAAATTTALAAKADAAATATALNAKAAAADLAAETSARQAADTTLQGNIDAKPSTSAMNTAIAAAVATKDTTGILGAGAQGEAAGRTLNLTDAGKYLRAAWAADATLTVPPNSSVAFPLNTIIQGIQASTGRVTIAPGSGVTINSLGNAKRTAGQFAGFTLVKIGTNEWDLMGSLVV